jgi:hypothetical protein
MAKLVDAPPTAETPGEPDQAHEERRPAAEQVGQLPAGQQKAPERKAVRRNHPLSIRGREVQRALRRR